MRIKIDSVVSGTKKKTILAGNAFVSFTTEGSKALISKAFNEMSASDLVAAATIENKASIRIMEKSGLIFQKNLVDGNSGQTVSLYRLQKSEFINSYKINV